MADTPVFQFATVGAVYEDGITLIFDGQEEASEKRYKCNTSISFAAGDRVKIAQDSGTYVVEYVLGCPKSDFYGDRNTLLLLHGDSVEDSSGYKNQIYNYRVQPSSSVSKFGGKSLYFDGNSYLKLDEVIPSSGDFTVDWWEYVTGYSATRFAQSIQGGIGGIAAGGSENYNRLYVSGNGTSWDIINNLTAFSTSQNEWAHFALVRCGDTWSTYKNGSEFISQDSQGNIFKNGNGLIIGSFLYDSFHYFNGYIDEFRISSVARWTHDFTPPAKPYSS